MKEESLGGLFDDAMMPPVHEVVDAAAEQAMCLSKSSSERFKAWLARNSDIIEVYKKFAMQVKSAGYSRYGIAAITERVRWHYQFERDVHEDFKINNNYRSRMARLLMEQYPELDGFFEIRKLKTV